MARKLSMKQAVNEAIDQEMSRDPSVIMMGEDIVGGAGCNGEEDAWGGVLGVTKGLYAKARRRDLKNFTGIDSPYQPPLAAEVHLHPDHQAVLACIDDILAQLT